MRNEPLSDRQALLFRLGVGAIFGLGAGWLAKMLDAQHAMPDIRVHVGLSVLLLGAFVLWAGAGTMRRLSLAAWGVVALGVIAWIAWNHFAATGEEAANPVFFDDHFLIYPFLFIAHELVSSADMAGKPVAPFSLYFDQAWKRGVQLVLAVAFTVLFWAILWLGAALLGFIGFDWLKTLLENEYFIGPAIGLALAAGIHLGDVQTKLLANVRALVLGVLSWLLPVIVVIGVIFAVSLGFSGLAPLWATKAATMTLLGACVALVLLINAAYQQGDEERKVHVVLKWAVRVAAGLLLIFAGLAAYSLHLRIDQYGLTPERVLAMVGVFVAVLFGLGYAYAAVSLRGRWMVGLETVNIALAFVKVAVFLAVLTPIADPARVSVASQVARLEDGRVPPDRFDWKMLRFTTGIYGANALDRLSREGKTKAIRDAAIKARAIKETDRYDMAVPALETGKPDPAHLAVVAPKGAAIPADFLAGNYKLFMPGTTSKCLPTAPAGATCYAAMVDLNHDGEAEILILDDTDVTIYARDGERWRAIDTIYMNADGAAAFQQGQVSAGTPAWDDAVIGVYHQKVDDTTK